MESLRNFAEGFVLVGGRSRRMGRDKALLELDGKPLFLRTAHLLEPYVKTVTLLGPPGRYSGFGFPVLPDREPGLGPLGALHTGLQSSLSDWNLFFACDLPFLSRRIIELLLRRVSESDAQAVVPVAGNRQQPLCGAYHRDCLGSMEAMFEQRSNPALGGLLARLRVDVLTPEPPDSLRGWEEMFFNANTPQEWEQVQSGVATAAR
jgi:molybdopterin-guanine dinucleotide biosynthesis protein A